MRFHLIVFLLGIASRQALATDCSDFANTNKWTLLSGATNNVCPTGQTMCGGYCYQPKTTDCSAYQNTANWQSAGGCPSSGVCPSGSERCGDHCYKPKPVDCSAYTNPSAWTLTSASSNGVCPSGQTACGGYCYKPKTADCSTYTSSGSYQLIGGCPSNGVCPTGSQKCGDYCYVPKATDCSAYTSGSSWQLIGACPSNGVCPTGSQKCGDYCYVPKTTTDCSAYQNTANYQNFGPPIGGVCPSGSILCGSYCYSKKTPTTTTQAPTPRPGVDCLPPVSQPLYNCKKGWQYFPATGKQYMVAFDKPESIPAGEEYCVSQGGHLASIHSDAENQFISNLCCPSNSPSYWGWPAVYLVGGHAVNGNWTWSDGSPFDYWGSECPPAGVDALLVGNACGKPGQWTRYLAYGTPIPYTVCKK